MAESFNLDSCDCIRIKNWKKKKSGFKSPWVYQPNLLQDNEKTLLTRQERQKKRVRLGVYLTLLLCYRIPRPPPPPPGASFESEAQGDCIMGVCPTQRAKIFRLLFHLEIILCYTDLTVLNSAYCLPFGLHERLDNKHLKQTKNKGSLKNVVTTLTGKHGWVRAEAARPQGTEVVTEHSAVVAALAKSSYLDEVWGRWLISNQTSFASWHGTW